MCSQTLRAAAVGAVWNGSNVRTTKVREGQSEGAGQLYKDKAKTHEPPASSKEAAAKARQMKKKRQKTEGQNLRRAKVKAVGGLDVYRKQRALEAAEGMLVRGDAQKMQAGEEGL